MHHLFGFSGAGVSQMPGEMERSRLGGFVGGGDGGVGGDRSEGVIGVFEVVRRLVNIAQAVVKVFGVSLGGV